MNNDQSYNINEIERNNFPQFLENRECKLKTKKVLKINTKSNKKHV